MVNLHLGNSNHFVISLESGNNLQHHVLPAERDYRVQESYGKRDGTNDVEGDINADRVLGGGGCCRSSYYQSFLDNGP